LEKTIKKSLRFTIHEYQKIDEQLKKSNLTFSDFARGILLKEKIRLPIEIELIHELNLIQIQLDELLRNLPEQDRLKILSLLVSIEKKFEKLI